MKSGFWQIQIQEEDKYKTAFTVPFGHYEWNVIPFGLKNAPSEFKNIMNDIIGKIISSLSNPCTPSLSQKPSPNPCIQFY